MRVPLPEAFLRQPLAHRALHNLADGRPENSPAAILAAIDAGYGLEIDVQCSRDGVAMVFHDETLDHQTHETGLVAERSAADLGTITLAGGKDTIPTLRAILALVAGRAPLLIEIKDQTAVMGPTDGILEKAVARDLAGYIGPVAVMSYNPHSVAHMADFAPNVPRGLTTSAFIPAEPPSVPAKTCEALRAIADYDRTLSSFISHDIADLARPRVAELRAQGAAILCWTVKSPKAEAEARRYAQNITFDDYLAPLT